MNSSSQTLAFLGNTSQFLTPRRSLYHKALFNTWLEAIQLKLKCCHPVLECKRKIPEILRMTKNLYCTTPSIPHFESWFTSQHKLHFQPQQACAKPPSCSNELSRALTTRWTQSTATASHRPLFRPRPVHCILLRRPNFAALLHQSPSMRPTSHRTSLTSGIPRPRTRFDLSKKLQPTRRARTPCTI
jgi:hypothetical protein